MPRGLTAAAKAAKKYLEKNPQATVLFLAAKFGLDTSTIYRASWWKENKEKQCQAICTR